MNGLFECRFCKRCTWMRMARYGEWASDKAWETAEKDGDLCEHALADGCGSLVITDQEPEEI